MIPLTPTAALEKNTSTNAFKTDRWGYFTLYVRGNLSNETLTLECSADNSSWKSFSYDGVAQTYTNNADIINAIRYELGGKFYFRYTMSNGAGTPSGVRVDVDGTNVSRP
jgi:hypothetical protein